MFVQDGKPLPGVAQVAMQQGTHAGRNIRRAIAGQPLEPFRYKDYGIMATIGRGAAVGDIFGLKISGFFAWLFWIFLHIFWLIGFRNRFVVMTRVGVGLLLAPAPRSADYRRFIRINRTMTSQFSRSAAVGVVQ